MSERAFMEQALALAALGEGTTSPNPRVGCVIAQGERAVGWGMHRAAGSAHAEQRALEIAGAKARGATVYVTLEPCAHHGRTPPCADLLVERGVKRVVASITDPNPLVNGEGFRRLRRAGIEVELGLLGPEAASLNEPFLHWHTRGRPLVTLKAAVSLDGMLAALDGRSRWITGEPARRLAHRLRLRHDAVLVGAGTVRRDDPGLDVRLPGVAAPRIPVVLAPGLDLDPGARLFTVSAGRARVYAAAELPASAAGRFAGRATVVPVPRLGAGLDLGAVLEDLGRAGVQSLLVEGGGRTLAGFLDAGYADRAAIFVAPKLLGARGATPLLDREAARAPDDAWRIEAPRYVPCGEDLLVLGRIARPPGS